MCLSLLCSMNGLNGYITFCVAPVKHTMARGRRHYKHKYKS